MSKIEKDMHEIARFVPMFFGGLSLIVGALPVIAKLLGVLPEVIRYQNIATTLATVATYAIIGSDYLRHRENDKPENPNIGGMFILFGVILCILYIGVADWFLSKEQLTKWWEELIAIVGYVLIYSFLAYGLWKMSLRAYQTKDFDIWINPDIEIQTAAQAINRRNQ